MQYSLNDLLDNPNIQYIDNRGAVAPLTYEQPLTSLIEKNVAFDIESQTLGDEMLIGVKVHRNVGKSTDAHSQIAREIMNSTNPCAEIPMSNSYSAGAAFKQEYLCSFEEMEQATIARAQADAEKEYLRQYHKAMRFAEMYGGLPRSMESKRYPSNKPDAAISMMDPSRFEGIIMRPESTYERTTIKGRPVMVSKYKG